MRFLLVHSPAVGPSTWRWVGAALQSHGHEAIIPDLVAAARSGEPQAFVQGAVEAVADGEEVVVVGHSAAGIVLPLVGALLAEVRCLLFVDARVPPCDGTVTIGGDFQAVLRGLAADGALPVWSRWWGDDVLPALVRDGARRKEIEAELPALPLAFFEAPISLPDGWCAGAGGFLLLSAFYRTDATAAATRGWPVAERPGAHLDMANDEEEIARLLVELAGGR